jgi:hypothetical protein
VDPPCCDVCATAIGADPAAIRASTPNEKFLIIPFSISSPSPESRENAPERPK